MQTQGAKDQRAYREREKAKVLAILDDLLDDVDIFTEWKDGKRVVTFDMGKDTNAALELVAAAQGKTLDQILRGVVAKSLKEGAKLKLVKDKHEAAQLKLVKDKHEAAQLKLVKDKHEAAQG